jgi:hypothetical protein
MNLDWALKCFEENIRLFGQVQTQPEKYNLYNGLANLAHGLIQMQGEIANLRQEVDLIRRALK